MASRKAAKVVITGDCLRNMFNLPEGCILHFDREEMDRNLFHFTAEGEGMPDVPEGAEPAEVGLEVTV